MCVIFLCSSLSSYLFVFMTLKSWFDNCLLLFATRCTAVIVGEHRIVQCKSYLLSCAYNVCLPLDFGLSCREMHAVLRGQNSDLHKAINKRPVGLQSIVADILSGSLSVCLSFFLSLKMCLKWCHHYDGEMNGEKVCAMTRLTIG